MDKLNEFARYLEERGAPASLLTIKNSLFFQKRQIATHDARFRNDRYFIAPDYASTHHALIHHLKGIGLHFLEGQLRSTHTPNLLVLGGTELNYTPPAGSPPKVAALVHVYNEADILPETIRHLLAQGLHVHVIDNWSTDAGWEIAGTFPASQVTRERFPAEGPGEDYEWFKQLQHSEELASILPFDWFLHYDADEFRYSPWPGVSLQHAIAFIDGLGYNAIDFTILDFRYTRDHDQVRDGFEANNTWFEFGNRSGHFVQIKGWKKQTEKVDLKNSGGHEARFPGRKVYPIKFLTKHYSLRSKAQAEKKLVSDRLPRVQKELKERSWHHHIELLMAQQARGWEKDKLIQYIPGSFEKDFLIERISGIGIPRA